MRLKDKVAIITGGSRGIGFATADKFLKEGTTVVLAAISKESADTAVDKLKEKYPNAIVAGISPNLASMESVRKAFKEATEKYGCVDILVNNAGISENTSFMDYTEETFDKVMDLNVKGVFNTTRVAAECMVARGKGVILSTSSMVSISGQPSGFAYPASKFAVNGLTVSLARELGSKRYLPTHVFISKYDMTGIRKGSLALAEQVMSISTKCIIEKCGRVNKWSLDRVLKAVRIQMGMEGEGHDGRGI